MRGSRGTKDDGRSHKSHGRTTGDGEVLQEGSHVGRRARAPLMTRADFERQWPEVSARLSRALLSWGASPELTDDLVQQVALKALVSNEPVSGPLVSFQAWCLTAGRHLHIDHSRRRSECVAYELIDAVDASDVLSRVCDRMDLAVVLAAMRSLPERERRLLIEAVEGRLPKQERRKALAVYQDVRRIRVKLRHELGAVIAGLGALLGARRHAATSKGSIFVAVSTVSALFVLLPAVNVPAVAGPDGQAERLGTITAPIVKVRDSSPKPRERPRERRCVASCTSLPARATNVPAQRGPGTNVTVVRSTPVGPVGVDSRPSSREGSELVCARDLPAGLTDICVDEPHGPSRNF